MLGACLLVTTLINELQVEKRIRKRAGEMGQQVKALALKSNELSPALRNHELEVKG